MRNSYLLLSMLVHKWNQQFVYMHIVCESLICHLGAEIEFPCQILSAPCPFRRWHVALFIIQK